MTKEVIKSYNFTLTLEEANVIMACLKKAPMEIVENVVLKLNAQYTAQVAGEKAKEDAHKATTAKETAPVQEVVQAPKVRKKA